MEYSTEQPAKTELLDGPKKKNGEVESVCKSMQNSYTSDTYLAY